MWHYELRFGFIFSSPPEAEFYPFFAIIKSPGENEPIIVFISELELVIPINIKESRDRKISENKTYHITHGKLLAETHRRFCTRTNVIDYIRWTKNTSTSLLHSLFHVSKCSVALVVLSALQRGSSIEL